jgi:hypothetical protein
MMAKLECLLLGALMMLPLNSLTLLLSSMKASLLRMAGSMVSGVSSGIVVAYIGKLYADRSSKLNLGEEVVLGDSGGESLSGCLQ